MGDSSKQHAHNESASHEDVRQLKETVHQQNARLQNQAFNIEQLEKDYEQQANWLKDLERVRDELQSEVDRLNRDHQDSAEQLQARLQESENQLVETRQQLQSKQHQIQVWQNEVEEHENRISELIDQVETLSGERNGLQKNLEQERRQYQELEKQRCELESRCGQYEDDKNQLKSALRETRQRCGEMENAIEVADREKAEALQEQARLHEKVDRLNRTIQEFQHQRDEETGRCAQAQAELESAIADARARADALQAELAGRDKRLEEAESWRRELQQWYDNLRVAADGLEHEKVELEERLAEAEARNQQQSEQADRYLLEGRGDNEEPSRREKELEHSVASLQNERDQLKAELSAGRNHQDDQIQQMQRNLHQRDEQIKVLRGEILALQREMEQKELHAEADFMGDMILKESLFSKSRSGSRTTWIQRKNWLWGLGVAAALLVAVWFYNVQKPAYRLTGMVVLPRDNQEAADVAVSMTEEYPELESELDAAHGLLRLSCVTHQPRTGAEQLNVRGYALADKINAVVASQPAETKEDPPGPRARLAQMAEQMSELIADLRDPEKLTSDTNRRQLKKAWRSARQEKERLVAELEEAKAGKVNPPPPVEQIAIDPDKLTTVEEADTALRAAISKANELRGQMARQMVNTLDSQAGRFESLQKTLRKADEELKQLSAGGREKKVRESLQILRQQLSKCNEQATQMGELWGQYREKLSEASLAETLSNALNQLGPSAKDFVTHTQNVLDKADQARNELLEQSDSQPTKLVVLNKSIQRILKKVGQKRDEAAEAAETFWLARNVPLATLAGELFNGRQQVVARRQRIAEHLRNQAHARLAKDYQQRQRARDERRPASSPRRSPAWRIRWWRSSASRRRTRMLHWPSWWTGIPGIKID